MRKILIALALVLTTTAIALPQAQAQAPTYPDVKNVTPFTAQANYMSKAGYLRYRYFVQSGTWISYEEADRIAREQGQG